MRKVIMVLTLATTMTLLLTIPAFAHGGEAAGSVDAQTLIKQAISFLEGTQDVDMAKIKINLVLLSNVTSVDKSQLQSALNYLNSNDINKAELALLESIGVDPQNAVELKIQPAPLKSGQKIAISLFAVVLVIIGAVIVAKGKVKRSDIPYV